MRNSLFCIVFLFIGFAGASQSVNWTQLLNNAAEDPIADRYLDASQVDYGDISIIDKLEFRTETDEFDLDRQEYTFRSSFINPAQRRISRQLSNNQGEEYNIKAKERITENYLACYESIIDLYFLSEKQKLQEEILSILSDEKIVLDKEIVTDPAGKVMELYDLEEEINEETFKLNRQALVLQQLKKGLFVDEIEEINWSNFICIPSLMARMQTMQEAIKSHPDLAFEENQLQANEIKLQLEKASQDQLVDFLQLKYNGPRNNLTTAETFSIGAGFIIPTKNKNRERFNRIERDMLENEIELEEIVVLINNDILSIMNKLSILDDERTWLIERIENNDLEEQLLDSTKGLLQNPSDILKIKKKQIERQEELLSVEHEMHKLHLELLETTGAIFNDSSINYLHELQSSIDN